MAEIYKKFSNKTYPSWRTSPSAVQIYAQFWTDLQRTSDTVNKTLRVHNCVFVSRTESPVTRADRDWFVHRRFHKFSLLGAKLSLLCPLAIHRLLIHVLIKR